MSERAYTVKELDDLRAVVGNKWLYGYYRIPYRPGGVMSRSHKEEEKYNCVEAMVRTHMLAGHTAQDLLDSENPAPDFTGE